MFEQNLASAGCSVTDEWVEKPWHPTWLFGDFDLDQHFHSDGDDGDDGDDDHDRGDDRDFDILTNMFIKGGDIIII